MTFAEHDPEPPVQPEVALEPARHRPRWMVPALIAGAVVLVAGASAAVALTLAGLGGEDGDGDDVLTVHGTLQLDGDGSLTVALPRGLGALCEGDGGYSDIGAGAQVTVTAPDGTVLAIGALDEGKMLEPGALGEFDRFGICEFSFAVTDVPAGHGLYGIEIAGRGVVTYEEDRLRSVTGGPALTLGG